MKDFTLLSGFTLDISANKLGFDVELVSARPINKKYLLKEAN